MDSVITPDRPILECELPLDGSRFEALIPPLVERPTFALRKKGELIFTLEHYVERAIMSAGQRDALEQAVAQRQNILVCAGKSTGRTALANAAGTSYVSRRRLLRRLGRVPRRQARQHHGEEHDSDCCPAPFYDPRIDMDEPHTQHRAGRIKGGMSEDCDDE